MNCFQSSLNPSNSIPSFSLGEYYDFKNNTYTSSQNDSNEFDHCDCLRTNPLLVTSDICKMSLDQDLFNENGQNVKGKRSIILDTSYDNTNDWTPISSLVIIKNEFDFLIVPLTESSIFLNFSKISNIIQM